MAWCVLWGGAHQDPAGALGAAQLRQRRPLTAWPPPLCADLAACWATLAKTSLWLCPVLLLHEELEALSAPCLLYSCDDEWAALAPWRQQAAEIQSSGPTPGSDVWSLLPVMQFLAGGLLLGQAGSLLATCQAMKLKSLWFSFYFPRPLIY